MTAIKVQAFGGMIPASDDRLLPDTSAALAENTWLYAGSLQGMPTRQVMHTCSSLTRSVFRIPLGTLDRAGLSNSYWLEFPDYDVSVVRTPLVSDQYARYYWCGPETSPYYNTRNRITGGNTGINAPFKLGVPAPSAAPGVAPALVPADTQAPEIASGSALNYMVTLQFRENRKLNVNAMPPVTSFVVTSTTGATTTTYTVASVAVGAALKQVYLILGEQVAAGVTLSVTYTLPTTGLAIQDEAGNAAAAFAVTAPSQTLDTLPPAYVSSSVSGTTLSIMVSDNVGLSVTAIPATSAFTVTAAGIANPVTAVSIVSGTTNTVALTLTNPVGAGAVVTLGYVSPGGATALQDGAGNMLPSISSASVTNATPSTLQPVFSTGSVNGNTATLNFSAAYNLQSGVPISAFAIKVTGIAQSVGSVSVSGTTVTLTFYQAASSGDAVTASYAVPTTNQLRDINNNLAVAFSNQALTNDTPAIPTEPNEPEGGGGGGGGLGGGGEGGGG